LLCSSVTDVSTAFTYFSNVKRVKKHFKSTAGTYGAHPDFLAGLRGRGKVCVRKGMEDGGRMGGDETEGVWPLQNYLYHDAFANRIYRVVQKRQNPGFNFGMASVNVHRF